MITNRLLKAVAIIVLSSTALAATNEPHSLKTIMQGLRGHVLTITAGLVSDDLDQVGTGANRITEHASISSAQRRLIAAELGSELAEFKRIDKQVHDLSLSIAAAAQHDDRKRAFAEYRQMLASCLACHAAYKDRLAAVLSKEPSRSN